MNYFIGLSEEVLIIFQLIRTVTMKDKVNLQRESCSEGSVLLILSTNS